MLVIVTVIELPLITWAKVIGDRRHRCELGVPTLKSHFFVGEGGAEALSNTVLFGSCIIQSDPHRPTQIAPTRPNPLSKEKIWTRPDPT